MSNLRIQKKKLQNRINGLKYLLRVSQLNFERSQIQPIKVKVAIKAIDEVPEEEIIRHLVYNLLESKELTSILKANLIKEKHPFEFVNVCSTHLEVLPPVNKPLLIEEGLYD